MQHILHVASTLLNVAETLDGVLIKQVPSLQGGGALSIGSLAMLQLVQRAYPWHDAHNSFLLNSTDFVAPLYSSSNVTLGGKEKRVSHKSGRMQLESL